MGYSMNIYVGNLAFAATEEGLQKLFEQFGTVVSVKIIKDKFSGEPRGFAFVEMSSAEEGNQAIEGLNNTEFEGRQLRVNEARPPKAGGGPRGGNRHGGGNRFR